MAHIDLNADLGEGCGDDAALMPLVTRVNIACGGHAGDAQSMQATLALCAEHGVVAGAHPSYPDREGFGRRSGFLSGSALTDSLYEQVAALKQEAGKTGVALDHLKPHGALYNDANRSAEIAEMIARVAADESLRLLGPPAGESRAAAERAGVSYLAEGFADRAYRPDGSLVPRSEAGAVFEDAALAARQALSLVEGKVQCIDGRRIDLAVDTLCLHGDTPRALQFANAVREALGSAGVRIRAAS